MNTAYKAIQHGMTVFYVKDSFLFTTILHKAPQYGHSMVFLEDIDEIASGEMRDSRMNDVLNVLDGIDTKGKGIKVFLTTNHPERLSPALRRPGRIDIVIELGNPDADTAIKIIKRRLGIIENTPPKYVEIDWEMVKQNIPDTSGAVISEMALRLSQWIAQGYIPSTQLVLEAIEALKPQMTLMAAPVDTGGDKIKEALALLFKTAYNGGLDF